MFHVWLAVIELGKTSSRPASTCNPSLLLIIHQIILSDHQIRITFPRSVVDPEWDYCGRTEDFNVFTVYKYHLSPDWSLIQMELLLIFFSGAEYHRVKSQGNYVSSNPAPDVRFDSCRRFTFIAAVSMATKPCVKCTWNLTVDWCEHPDFTAGESITLWRSISLVLIRFVTHRGERSERDIQRQGRSTVEYVFVFILYFQRSDLIGSTIGAWVSLGDLAANWGNRCPDILQNL